MSGSTKIQGIPVKQCQSKASVFGEETCGKAIEAEQQHREAKGEKCSVYMDVFNDNGNHTTTVLTLVCKGKKTKSHPKTAVKDKPAARPKPPRAHADREPTLEFHFPPKKAQDESLLIFIDGKF